MRSVVVAGLSLLMGGCVLTDSLDDLPPIPADGGDASSPDSMTAEAAADDSGDASAADSSFADVGDSASDATTFEAGDSGAADAADTSDGADAAVCAPASSMCGGTDGATFMQCKADGSGYTSTTCTSAALCNPTTGCEVCAPGSSSCVGSMFQQCKADGSGYNTAACASAVACDATKGCLSCVPGSTTCSGANFQTCKVDGSGYATTTCASAAQCNATTGCLACVPGSASCSGATYQQCKADGSGYTMTTCASAAQCSATSGCLACVPGSTTCSGANFETCKADGSGYSTTACASAALCSASGCAAPACSAGATSCSGRNLLTCNSGLTGYTPSRVCGITCSGGACVDVAQVSVGSIHACALGTDGSVYCWGENDSGRIGNGGLTPLYVLAPSKVALPKPATAVAVTDSSSHAWLTDRTIASWGNNAGGQLGIGSTASSAPTPTLIPSFFADGFSAGYASACARVGDYLECWGANPQVGAGTATGTYTSPTFVVMYDYSTASGFTGDQLAVVGSDSCVVDRSSGLHCWGVNGSGQLLTGDTTNVSHYVGTLSNVSSLGQSATNTATICAVRSAGSVDCWGRDLVSGTSVTTPTTVPGTSGATSVAVGRQHACAILTGGSLVCWGQNGGYQLGATSPSSSATPLTVPLSGVTQVSAGDSFTCAVAAGRAYCWGNGGQGQLGNGAKTATAAPTEPAWP